MLFHIGTTSVPTTPSTTPKPTTAVPTTTPVPRTTTALSTTTPIPTTAIPTTTAFHCDQRTNDLSFNSIQGNVLITPSYNFTVYNSPKIVPEQGGSAYLELKKKGQYMKLPNVGLECIQDMTKCDHGFTLSVEIKFHNLNSTNKLLYIL